MLETVGLVLFGLLMLACALVTLPMIFDYGLDIKLIGLLLTLLLLGGGVFLIGAGVGVVDLGEDDPCVHYVLVGKVTVPVHKHGWIEYGGRPVWCD